MARDVTARDLTPAAGLPLNPPPAARPRVLAPVGGGHLMPIVLLDDLRPENRVSLDTVVFTAACPACGDDARWTRRLDASVGPIPLTITCERCDRDTRPRCWPA